MPFQFAVPLIVVAIVIDAVSAKAQGLGCDCPDRKLTRFSDRVRLAFSSADTVFLGTVISVEERPGTEYYRTRWATFAVEKLWKGALAKERVVWTTIPCGFRFKAGERYLIYGTRYHGTLYADPCNRSVFVTGADLREMNLLTRMSSGP